MSTWIVWILLLLLAIVAFFAYSYLKNQRSRYVISLYKKFQKEYGACARISMGFFQRNPLSKSIIVMLAVGKDNRIVDAWIVTDKDMNIDARAAREYIGMDIDKYQIEKEKQEKNHLYKQQKQEQKTIKEKAFDMALKQILNQDRK